MATSPQSFWEDYRKQIEAEIAQIQDKLTPLEEGQMHIGERSANEPWRDTTQAWIDHHKRNIAMYETILAAIKKREAP